MKYRSLMTGWLGIGDEGNAVFLTAGDEYDEDHPGVAERPEIFEQVVELTPRPPVKARKTAR